jgi:hypothetical protein
MPTPPPSPLPPISKHHVLHLSAVIPTLPSHLVKSLFLLAYHADHRTGEARPGLDALERWDVPYSTWHRHMCELVALGIVRQTVKGNKRARKAATYRLLYVTPLTAENSSMDVTAKDPSPERGGGSVSESEGRGGEKLTQEEIALWCALRDRIVAQLDPADVRRLNEQLPGFEQLTRLRRTAIRLKVRVGDYEVVEALTRRKHPHQPAYDGAACVPAAMWSRLRRLAVEQGVDMADTTPVVTPRRKEPAEGALTLLTEQVPGLAGAFLALSSQVNPSGPRRASRLTDGSTEARSTHSKVAESSGAQAELGRVRLPAAGTSGLPTVPSRRASAPVSARQTAGGFAPVRPQRLAP